MICVFHYSRCTLQMLWCAPLYLIGYFYIGWRAKTNQDLKAWYPKKYLKCDILYSY